MLGSRRPHYFFPGKDRNRQIASRVLAGETLGSVGRDFDLTRETVRGIVFKVCRQEGVYGHTLADLRIRPTIPRGRVLEAWTPQQQSYEFFCVRGET